MMCREGHVKYQNRYGSRKRTSANKRKIDDTLDGDDATSATTGSSPAKPTPAKKSNTGTTTPRKSSNPRAPRQTKAQKEAAAAIAAVATAMAAGAATPDLPAFHLPWPPSNFQSSGRAPDSTNNAATPAAADANTGMDVDDLDADAEGEVDPDYENVVPNDQYPVNPQPHLGDNNGSESMSSQN